MLHFAETCNAIAATTKKLEKTALVAAYLQSLLLTNSLNEAATAAIFLSGRPFPAYEEATLQVGGALLWQVISELSRKSEHQLTEIYRKYGDAGSVAAEALPARTGSELSLGAAQQAFSEIAAARGGAAKASLLCALLERATPLEAKYIVKIISGDLRIGLKESLVEEAIARAFETPLDQVKRANMLLGDIGETLCLASADKLADAHLRLFHSIDFMLASPVESGEEALSYFRNVSAEDKYDGIRAQAHIGGGEVRIFSRTRDEITESFPELPAGLAGLAHDSILDGEIVAWNSDGKGRALPFSALQRRLGRKKVSVQLMREVPVAYLVFDILYCDGELLLDRPLRERAVVLDNLMNRVERSASIDGHVGTDAPVCPAGRSSATPSQRSQTLFSFATIEPPAATVLRAPVAAAHSPQDIETLFTAARDRGNEGLMIKDLDSLYTPGRRGKSWLKMKRELATLDVVVTAVEYGHGKRIGVLSDYTFAVWDGERLVNIGKAYSGLADVEIAEMTRWFLQHKISEQGFRLEVKPEIVLEVAFNNMMRSTRHESGYALRFPRIIRLRPDKLPEDADTIDTVKEIYEQQKIVDGR
ncbi:MAG TPA: ATP-dependent DNA ligase [Terriglobales bacterium]|jgi:DNA ligase-1|nr:ATP-dependent DNA ligase [Terriglobales bacterium]